MTVKKEITIRNKRTGKPLARSTIRRRLVSDLKALGYRIKRTGDLNKIEAEKP